MTEGGQRTGRRGQRLRECSPCAPNDQDKTAVNLPTELCRDHMELMELYCKHHSRICCVTCIALEHRSCETVLFIPTSTDELLQSVNIAELKSKIETTVKELESVKLKQQSTQAGLDDERKHCLGEIKEKHRRLQEMLDKLTNISKDGIQKTYYKLTSDLNQHSQKIEEQLANLKAADDQLNNCYINDAQRFVEMKKTEEIIEETGAVTKAAMANMRTRRFDAVIDFRLEHLMQEMRSLAIIVESAQIINSYAPKVTIKGDKNVCSISGSCALHDGSVLMADHSNQKLKRFDSKTLSVIDFCVVKGHPQDVCSINDNEAVVTMLYSLVFVSLKPILKQVRVLSLGHFCRYTSVVNDALFVTDGERTIYVYNTKGVLLRTIIPDPTGVNVFPPFEHLAISEEDEKIFVAEYDTGVISLDLQGNVLGNHSYSEISGVQGICLDGAGGLFVCGRKSNNVIHVSRRGNVLGEVVSGKERLVGPRSVSFDKANNRLYVFQDSCNIMLVFDIYMKV